MRWAVLGLAWLAMAPVAVAYAVDDAPLPVPVDRGGAPSAEAGFNEGRALAEGRDWAGAERKYREAIQLDPREAEELAQAIARAPRR